jgi:hypothetical protein
MMTGRCLLAGLWIGGLTNGVFGFVGEEGGRLGAVGESPSGLADGSTSSSDAIFVACGDAPLGFVISSNSISSRLPERPCDPGDGFAPGGDGTGRVLFAAKLRSCPNSGTLAVCLLGVAFPPVLKVVEAGVDVLLSFDGEARTDVIEGDVGPVLNPVACSALFRAGDSKPVNDLIVSLLAVRVLRAPLAVASDVEEAGCGDDEAAGVAEPPAPRFDDM